MPTRIKADFTPSNRVYDLMATRYGITVERAREFIGHELGDFMMYWEGRTDAKAAKANWDSTCLNWMKRQYDDKKEAMARNRVYGKDKPNLVQEVAAGLMAQDMEKPGKKPKSKYRFQDPPPDTGERLSQEDALEKLNQMFRGNS